MTGGDFSGRLLKASDSEFETLTCGGVQSDKAFEVVDIVSDLGAFETRVAPRWPGEAEDPG